MHRPHLGVWPALGHPERARAGKLPEAAQLLLEPLLQAKVQLLAPLHPCFSSRPAQGLGHLRQGCLP